LEAREKDSTKRGEMVPNRSFTDESGAKRASRRVWSLKKGGGEERKRPCQPLKRVKKNCVEPFSKGKTKNN